MILEPNNTANDIVSALVALYAIHLIAVFIRFHFFGRSDD